LPNVPPAVKKGEWDEKCSDRDSTEAVSRWWNLRRFDDRNAAAAAAAVDEEPAAPDGPTAMFSEPPDVASILVGEQERDLLVPACAGANGSGEATSIVLGVGVKVRERKTLMKQ